MSASILVSISRKQTCDLSPYKVVEELRKETRERPLWFGGISEQGDGVQRLKPQEQQPAALS